MPKDSPFIILFSRSADRAKLIQSACAEGGYSKVVTVNEFGLVESANKSGQSNVVIFDLNIPAPGDSDRCLAAIRSLDCPVSVFIETDDPSLMQSVLDAGASTYSVKGLTPERVVPIVQMAINRFAAQSQMQRELSDAREALEGKKLVDKAKAILMKTNGLTEQQAYALLRKTAMDRNCKMHEIAESLILSAGLIEP